MPILLYIYVLPCKSDAIWHTIVYTELTMCGRHGPCYVTDTNPEVTMLSMMIAMTLYGTSYQSIIHSRTTAMTFPSIAYKPYLYKIYKSRHEPVLSVSHH